MKTIHRQLQNMDFKGNSLSDNLLSNLLFGKIYIKNQDGSSYSYYQSKILYLKDNNLDEKYYAFICFKELISVFSRYIDISEDKLNEYTANELYILSQIATYFHELENKGLINMIIPNTDIYR